MNLSYYYNKILIRRHLAGKLSARQQQQLNKRRARNKRFAKELLLAEVLNEPPPLIDLEGRLLVKIAAVIGILAALCYVLFA